MSGRGKHHCVYRFFTEADELLYVGITANFPERLRAHVSKDWWHEVATVSVAHFPSRDDAHYAEIMAICHEDPKHNAFHLWREVAKAREAA